MHVEHIGSCPCDPLEELPTPSRVRVCSGESHGSSKQQKAERHSTYKDEWRNHMWCRQAQIRITREVHRPMMPCHFDAHALAQPGLPVTRLARLKQQVSWMLG